MSEKVKISPDQIRIPKGYDFSNKYFSEGDYKGDYILRTDAVWEKTKLKDWFRQYMKVNIIKQARYSTTATRMEDTK